MTESERIKLTILLHQYTPAERLTAMEIATILEFIEGRGFRITRRNHQRPHASAREAAPGRRTG